MLEGTVSIDEALPILVGFNVRRELLWKRGAESGDPLGVAWLTRTAIKGVPHRSEKQCDGIDESAIKIEQNSVGARFHHTAKLNARGGH
jgi:hypothetical protein